MAGGKRRSPSATIHQDSIDQATAQLEALPEKPKTDWSLRETIRQLQGSINAALERGYSHKEIAEMLAEQDIRISPASLKSYLADSNRAPEPAPTLKRRTHNAAATKTTASTKAAAEPEPASVAAATAEPEPAPETTPPPKKTCSTRTATKAKPATPTPKRKTAAKSSTSSTRRKKMGA